MRLAMSCSSKSARCMNEAKLSPSPTGSRIVNRILPAELAGQQLPPYLQNRLQVQDRHLDEIKKTFGGRLVGSVPELERDVTGLPMIEKLAAIMYGDGGR